MRSDEVTFCGNQKINVQSTHLVLRYMEAAVNVEFMGTYSLISGELLVLT